MITTPKKSRPAMNQYSPGVYFVQTDLHGVITSVNDFFARNTGLQPDKLINTFFPFYLENGWFIFDAIDMESLTGSGSTLEYEIPIFFNGRIISTQWFLSACQSACKTYFVLQWIGIEKQVAAGTAASVKMMSGNMTARENKSGKDAARTPGKNETQFMMMADAAPVMIWLTDEYDKFTYVNKYWTDFTGIQFSELSGNDWNILIHPADMPGVIAQYDKGYREKTPLSLVYRLQHKSGEYRWVLANAVPRFHDTGLFAGYMGSVVDIHDRKLAEEKIAFQAGLIENVSDIIISTNSAFNILTWNRMAEKIYGITAGQAAGNYMPDLIRYIYINSTVENVLQEIKEKGNWRGEVIFRNQQDNLVYLQSTVSALLGEKDSVQGYVFVNRDITEKIKAEESIKISEAFYRSLIGNSLNGIALTDTEGNVSFVAPSVQNILGYEPEELIGTNIFTLVHPDDVPLAKQAFAERVQNESKKEYIVIRVRRHDGRWLWCATHGHNLLTHPYVQSMVVYFSDDTRRKEMEDALSRKEQEFRNLAENAPAIITRLDKNARFVYHNRTLARLMRTPSRSIIGKTPAEAGLTGDALQKIMQAIDNVFANKTTETLTVDILRRDGSRLIFLNTMAPEFNENGEAESILSISSDITEMKHAEAALVQKDILLAASAQAANELLTEKELERKESERRLVESEIKFKSLFQSSLDIVNVLDDQYRVTFVTPSIKVVMGYDEEEVIGKVGLEFIHPEDAQRVAKALDELKKNPGQNIIIDTRIRNKKGDWVWMEGKGINKLNDPIINGIIVSFHDISDRKQSEQQLQGYSEHITNILSSITDGFIALDFNFNVLWWNPIAAQLTGVRDVDVLGKNLWEALPALKKTRALAEYRKAVANKTVVNFELYLDELKVYFDINAYPSQQGLFVYFKDITGRKSQEMLLTLEKEVLELNTNPAASLKDTLDYFLKGIESLNPGMTCSVQLLEEGEKRVRHLSGPSMPADFIRYINDLKMGDKVGSSGTALFFQKTVIAPDIMTDPLWEGYREIAAQYQLAACWSFPIVTSSNNVLGSFAAYYKKQQSPTDAQVALLSRAATLLGIIIENKQAEQKVNISNERYLLATKATNDAIWDYDIRQGRLYWGEGFYTLFGYKSNQPAGVPGVWEAKIHPEDKESVTALFEDAIKNRERGVIYTEYRFKKSDGKYAIVADRAFIVYDNDGEPARFVGSMQDVTERKKLEMQVLKQEIDKQKIIAQAVVDAQEKERAEIGKDLHDNVNQILSTAKLYLELAKSDVNQREALIKRSADSIFNAINEIRSISKALVPPSVKDLGLIDSVKDLVESLHMTRALRVKFVHKGDFEKVISDKQKLMLFRIIQEQVNNVLKHAEATKLFIELVMHEKQISLTVEDNGKGFELEKVRFKKGVGLSNIESRVSLFDGKVTITTAPARGCKLFIQVPIHNY